MSLKIFFPRMSMPKFVRPAAAVLLLIGFVSWILPLGAFIEAHQEGRICNGRRLVCMCTHRNHTHNEAIPLTYRRPGGRGEPSLSSPSFGGTFETVSRIDLNVAVRRERMRPPEFPLHDNPAPTPPEPVPKAA